MTRTKVLETPKSRVVVFKKEQKYQKLKNKTYSVTYIKKSKETKNKWRNKGKC
jgi:hypothetical protein